LSSETLSKSLPRLDLCGVEPVVKLGGN
jgi:hypothetical protein